MSITGLDKSKIIKKMLKKKKIYNCKYEKLQKLGEGAYGVVYKVAVTGIINK